MAIPKVVWQGGRCSYPRFELLQL